MGPRFARRLGSAISPLLNRIEALEARLLFNVGSPYSVPTNPETVTSLDPGWKFQLYTSGSNSSIGSTTFNDSSWASVTLPHTWDANSTNAPVGDGWYRQTITIPAGIIGEEIYLQFQGADLIATIYVDGTPVGVHDGGWEAFDVDVTSQMAAGAHLVAVDVNNLTNSNLVPAGGGDYTKEGGLYRSVSLVAVNKAHVALTEPVIAPDTSGNEVAGNGVYFSNSNVSIGISSANIQVSTVVDNFASTSTPVTVTSYLVDANGIIQAQQSSSITLSAGQKDVTVSQSATVASPTLWDGLINPYLYDLYVQVTNTNTGQLLDLNHQQVGIRSFSVDPNTGFYLDGEPYKLVGVNMHQDSGVPGLNGGVAGWAQTDAQQENDINIALSVGATMIRTAHYQRDPAFYSYCDQKGLIIESEFGLNDNVTSTTAGSEFVNNAEDMLTELIRQNYDHPSICFWSLYNEIGSSSSNGDLIATLSSLAHTLDATGRMTVGESNQFSASDTINTSVNLANFHPYNGWYGGDPATDPSALESLHAALPDEPIGVGEFGAGGSFYQYGTATSIPDPSSTSVYHSQSDQTAISEAEYAAISSQTYLYDTLVWTMFDFSSAGSSSSEPRFEGDTQGINDKGLVTRDRQNYKDMYYFYKASWNLPGSTRGYNTSPVIWISDHGWTDRDGSVTVPVVVFSNIGAPTLSLNGGAPITLTPQVLDTNTIRDAYSTSINLSAGANTIVVSATFNGTAYTNSVVWTYHAQSLPGTPLTQIQFTTTTSNVQSGYAPDIGQPVGQQSNGAYYGWTNSSGGALANTSGTYDRTTDTSAPYNVLSAQTGIIINPGNQWEYKLPNGEYDIEIVAADSLWSGIVDNLSVNGTTLHVPGISTSGGTYQAFYDTVVVTNGLLTISGGPGMVLADGNDGNGGNGSSSDPNITQGRISSVTVNVIDNTAPTVVDPATASASPVTTTSTNLSVLGGDAASGESALTYTWATTGMPPAPVTFSQNGTNAAKNTSASFMSAGTYNFQVTIPNPADGLSTTSSVTVNVDQTLTSITVLPADPTLTDGQTEQFSATANDQFGNALASQPAFTWSVGAGAAGSINSSSGLYIAPVSGPASDTVLATSGSVSGATAITVILSVIDAPAGNDTIRLVRGGANLLVFINSATPTYNVSFGNLTSVTVNGNTGTDSINIDFSGGASPVPSGGININGSTGAATLIVAGTSGNDTATVDANTINFDGSPITYNAVESIIINGNGGADTLNQTAQPGDAATLTFNGGTSGGPSSADTLNISGGTFTFAASAAGSGIQPISLSSLTIGSGSAVTLGVAAAHSDRWVLVLGSLTLAGTASRLDLGGNDMIVRAPASLATITTAIASGFNLGTWTGAGISSSAAAADTTHLTALGVMQNSTGTLFDNQNINPGDILVKYTYVGDANLDGKVDASDYSRIDNGYLNQLTGWANGDFNYDGVVNGSDYTLIDNAFNMQAEPLAEIAPLGAETQPRTARVRLFAGNHLASPALQTVPQNTDVAQGTILDSDFSGDDILNSIRAKRRLFSQTRF